MCYDAPVVYGVRSAVLVIITDGQRFVTVRQLDFADALPKFVGGMMLRGELPAEAASRKVRDETGIRIKARRFRRVAHRFVYEPGKPRLYQYVMRAIVHRSLFDRLERQKRMQRDPCNGHVFEVSSMDREALRARTEGEGEFLATQRYIARMAAFEPSR